MPKPVVVTRHCISERIGLKFNNSDVYVNITGGIEIDEPAADLGIALAIITCARDVIVSPDTVLVGEIGLSGEIRNVPRILPRIKEAVGLGFTKCVLPYSSYKTLTSTPKGIELIPVRNLKEAVGIIR